MTEEEKTTAVNLSLFELQMLLESLEDAMHSGYAAEEYHLPLHRRLFDAYDELEQKIEEPTND